VGVAVGVVVGAAAATFGGVFAVAVAASVYNVWLLCGSGIVNAVAAAELCFFWLKGDVVRLRRIDWPAIREVYY